MPQKRDKRQKEPRIEKKKKCRGHNSPNLPPALLLQSSAFLLAQGNCQKLGTQSRNQMWLDLKWVGQPTSDANCVKFLGRACGKGQNNMGHLMKDEMTVIELD